MNAPLFSLTLADTLVAVTPLLVLGIVAALVLALNAALMLLAPTRTDLLPRFLRTPASAIATRYSITEIRLTGLLVLALLTWVVYDMLTRPH